MINYTPENFKDILQQAKLNNVPVVALFGAKWDMNTTRLFPLLDALMPKDVGTGMIDIDDYPDLAMEYGARIIPMLYLFMNTVAIKSVHGTEIKTAEDLNKFIKE